MACCSRGSSQGQCLGLVKLFWELGQGPSRVGTHAHQPASLYPCTLQGPAQIVSGDCASFHLGDGLKQAVKGLKSGEKLTLEHMGSSLENHPNTDHPMT